jgi:hypothetical protein
VLNSRATVAFNGVSIAARAALLALDPAKFSTGGFSLIEPEAAAVESTACEFEKRGDSWSEKALPLPHHTGLCGTGEAVVPCGENEEAIKGDPVPAKAANPLARVGGDGDGGGVTRVLGSSTTLTSSINCLQPLT